MSDLGSGSGRGVFAAALLHDFDRCVGVEVLEGLHAASLAVLKVLRALIGFFFLFCSFSTFFFCFVLNLVFEVAGCSLLLSSLGVCFVILHSCCSQRYEKDIIPQALPEQKKTEIVFAHANFLDYDWSHADVVFANSTW